MRSVHRAHWVFCIGNAASLPALTDWNSTLRIRSRLLLAVLVLAVLTAATLAWITVSQIDAHGEAELQRLKTELLETRKNGLKNLVDAAEAVVLDAKNDPDPSKEGPKVSYSTVIPGWDWMVGAGVYVTNIDREVTAAQAEIAEDRSSTIGFILLVTVVVVVIAMCIGLMVGRSVTKPLKKVSDMMQEIADGEGDLRQRLPENGSVELSELEPFGLLD